MTFVIEHLHFGASVVSGGIFGVFADVVNNTTIPFFSNFPVNFQFKITVLFVGHEVATAPASAVVHGTVVNHPFVGIRNGLSGFFEGVPVGK